MATREYSRYLQSAHWKRLRAEAIQEAGGQCRKCGSNENLAVHHRNYAHLGHERLCDLQVLCRKCHGELHGYPSSLESLCPSDQWLELRELVPMLGKLEASCFDFRCQARKVARAGYDYSKAEAAYSLCLSAWYGGRWEHTDAGLRPPKRGFKQQLSELVGWAAKDHPAGINKRTAYDIAYNHLFHTVLGL